MAGAQWVQLFMSLFNENKLFQINKSQNLSVSKEDWEVILTMKYVSKNCSHVKNVSQFICKDKLLTVCQANSVDSKENSYL